MSHELTPLARAVFSDGTP
jgi:hypothetical protein